MQLIELVRRLHHDHLGIAHLTLQPGTRFQHFDSVSLDEHDKPSCFTHVGSRMTLASTDYNDGFGRERKSQPDLGQATRSKMTVLAADAIDAVTAAGGLVFDRVRSGWAVDVYLAEPSDARPLRILGVNARQLLPDTLARIKFQRPPRRA